MTHGARALTGAAARLAASIRTPAGNRDRHLFRELNPGRDFSPILSSPPSRYRPAAVMIPVLARAEGLTVLLTVRSNDMPSHAGEISLPGGGIRPDDAGAIGAAMRETEEEVGLGPETLQVLGTFGVHFGGLGYAVTPVLGLVAPGADIVPCPREVDEVFEVPLSHLLDPRHHVIEERHVEHVTYRMFAVPWGGGSGSVRHIWGLTAGILHTLQCAWTEAGADSHDPLPVAQRGPGGMR